MAATSAQLAVTIDDVRAAAAAIAGQVVRTPTLKSETLSAITGAEIWLKFENLQFTSSFKDRGALNRLLRLTVDERRRGVIAMSAGNHAQGVAHHASRLGVPATIVMPRWTPNVKVASTEALGAEVVLHGDDVSAARDRAIEIAAERSLVYIPPFDDPWIIAGQGTVALEMLEDAPSIETIVVPVGGGGLLAGMSVAASAVRPDVEMIGVQSAQYPAVADAVHHTHHEIGGVTIAEGIAVPSAGTITTPIIAALAADVVAVPEEAIERGVNLLLEIEKTVAEGAGAVGLAAIIDDPERFRDRRVGVVVSGGNIDPRVLASIIMRGLVHTGRLTRVSVDITDVPGALSRVTGIIGELGGNIVEVAHQRLFSELTARAAVLELSIETRDHRHIERIVTALHAAGYKVTLGVHP
jgi:threonine dehydratase